MKTRVEIATEILESVENNILTKDHADEMLKAFNEITVQEDTKEANELIDSIIEEKKKSEECPKCGKKCDECECEEEDDDEDEKEEGCCKESTDINERLEKDLELGLISESSKDILVNYLS